MIRHLISSFQDQGRFEAAQKHSFIGNLWIFFLRKTLSMNPVDYGACKSWQCSAVFVAWSGWQQDLSRRRLYPIFLRPARPVSDFYARHRVGFFGRGWIWFLWEGPYQIGSLGLSQGLRSVHCVVSSEVAFKLTFLMLQSFNEEWEDVDCWSTSSPSSKSKMAMTIINVPTISNTEMQRCKKRQIW